MSGYAEFPAADQIFNGAASAFITKPFTPNVLLEKVREVLDSGIQPCR